MIHYELVCPDGHAFEGWFRSSADFEDQARAGRIACPQCGSAAISRAPMAPRIARGAKRAEAAAGQARPPQELVEAMRKLRRHVEANAEYVGPRFPEEARKIHYEEAEPRGIYGEASREEAKALKEEGVDVQALPVLPEDRN